MMKASYADKDLVSDLLTRAFDKNKSVNYLIRQNHNRLLRIRELMTYSFEQCMRFGEVYLSDDRKACALILYPHEKTGSVKSLMLDLKLAFQTISLGSLKKAWKREKQIKAVHPAGDKMYLWFIGVEPAEQHMGLGSQLLKEVLSLAKERGLPVYLETSTVQNLPWYKKHGFIVYHQLDLSYKLHFLKTT
jgi:ribosomal protein S18 acetylase RimI-like enzyme